MERLNTKRDLPSLLSLCIYQLTKNLSKLDKNGLEFISHTPNHIKNRLLRVYTKIPFFRKNTDTEAVLKALVNINTHHLDLSSWTLDDRILGILQPCQNLEKLYIIGENDGLLTTQGLLKLMPQLKHIFLLSISECEAMTDEVIACIAEHCLNLSSLDVGGCSRITDESLTSLATLQHLKWLNFSKTQVSDEGIDVLVEGLSGPNLRELRIDNCPNISENILKSVARHCPELEALAFHNCKKVQDQTCFLYGEGSLKNLKQLNWTIEW